MLFFSTSFGTSWGIFHLIAHDQALCRLQLPGKGPPPGMEEARDAPDHPLLKEARVQVLAYMDGTLRSFDLPLDPRGTPFQQAVWDQLLAIPYGKTRSYGEVAARLGNRNKARAVGGAAHVNPIALIIPCHRMIGADGGLTGFGGGLPLKRTLLELERRVCGGKEEQTNKKICTAAKRRGYD